MAESTATAIDRSPLNQPELKQVMGPKLLLLFIVGDILGTGIYAVTGNVANQVGGVVWLPFLVAFIVATMTAFSCLELVAKYPQACQRRALHPQGVRAALRHLPGLFHRDGLRHHLGLDRVEPSRPTSPPSPPCFEAAMRRPIPAQD